MPGKIGGFGLISPYSSPPIIYPAMIKHTIIFPSKVSLITRSLNLKKFVIVNICVIESVNV